MALIRAAHGADLPYLYEICYLTSDAPNPGSEVSERSMVGQYFAAPYLFFERELCFVVEENGVPSGYIVGTSDTPAYNAWFNASWLPALRRYFPASMKPGSRYEAWLTLIINQDAREKEFLAPYPSHLHINVLPSCQGKGYGRLLMERFLEGCRAKGSTGVHFGVGAKNVDAQRFYGRVGMDVLRTEPGVVYMGRRL